MERKDLELSLSEWEVRIHCVAVFSPRSRERTKGERKLVRQNKGMEETATISSLLPPRTVPQKVPETTVARLPDITVSQGDHYRRPEAVAHFPATLWQGTKGGSRRAVR